MLRVCTENLLLSGLRENDMNNLLVYSNFALRWGKIAKLIDSR